MSFVYFDKYKCKHVEDHNFTPRDNKENKDNNGADKKKFTPKIPNKKFTPNINNNCLVGPPRGKSLDGQAPTYSRMQIRTLNLLANVNTVNKNDDNNFDVRICIVEYVGACPSSDFPRGGPTRRLL